MTLHEEAKKYIQKLNLQPHPEGGYFSRFYKSTDEVKAVDPSRYNNENRSAGSSIFYLLNKTQYSAWHSLKSDEIWHYYKGSAIKIHVIENDGSLSTHLLGDALAVNQASFQVCVKAGNYFAAELIDKEVYSLVGCTVSPGFEFCDFSLADEKRLIEKFPHHQDIIKKFSIRQ